MSESGLYPRYLFIILLSLFHIILYLNFRPSSPRPLAHLSRLNSHENEWVNTLARHKKKWKIIFQPSQSRRRWRRGEMGHSRYIRNSRLQSTFFFFSIWFLLRPVISLSLSCSPNMKFLIHLLIFGDSLCYKFFRCFFFYIFNSHFLFVYHSFFARFPYTAHSL